MAQIKRSIAHGQSYDAARANFVRGIERAVAEHGKHFNPVVWSDDKTAATLSGTGFLLNLKVDPEFVHVDGQVPFFLKFLEGPVTRYVEQALRASPDRIQDQDQDHDRDQAR